MSGSIADSHAADVVTTCNWIKRAVGVWRTYAATAMAAQMSHDLLDKNPVLCQVGSEIAGKMVRRDGDRGASKGVGVDWLEEPLRKVGGESIEQDYDIYCVETVGTFVQRGSSEFENGAGWRFGAAKAIS